MPARTPYPTAAAFMPDTLTMSAVREAVQRGDARRRAARRPGGPGGRAVRRAGGQAARPRARGGGIDRRTAYVTNAVKRFKWKARGTRRIHDKPTWTEQMACRPWLDSELADIVVATIHPSAVLRADDREAMFAGLVDDLRTVAAGL